MSAAGKSKIEVVRLESGSTGKWWFRKRNYFSTSYSRRRCLSGLVVQLCHSGSVVCVVFRSFLRLSSTWLLHLLRQLHNECPLLVMHRSPSLFRLKLQVELSCSDLTSPWTCVCFVRADSIANPRSGHATNSIRGFQLELHLRHLANCHNNFFIVTVCQMLEVELELELKSTAVNFLYAGFVANGVVALPYLAVESWTATCGGMICLMR